MCRQQVGQLPISTKWQDVLSYAFKNNIFLDSFATVWWSLESEGPIYGIGRKT